MRDVSIHRCEVTHEALAALWLREFSEYYRAARAAPDGAGGSAAGRDAGAVVNASTMSEQRGR
jgi:hypothetical protein